MLGLLAAIALASEAPDASNQEADASPDCSRAVAIPTTIQDIMADPVRYQGACVAVTAITNGRLLFTSIEGYYRAGPLVGGDPDTNPNDRERLGLDNRKVLRRIPNGELRHATAFGRVQDCETIRDAVHASAGPDKIVMVMGFCHYANGPYVWLNDVTIREPVRATRLTGEDWRAEVGNLIPAPVDWPHRRFVEEKAHSYLDALRRGNKAAFKELHLESEKPDWMPSAVRLAFGSHRGFTALRRAKGMPQVAIFVEHFVPYPREAGAAEILEGPNAEPDDYNSTVCFCTLPDCTGLWPISAIDADNREDRPYVCTELQSYMVFRKGAFPAFSTERGRHGLPEPRR